MRESRKTEREESGEGPSKRELALERLRSGGNLKFATCDICAQKLYPSETMNLDGYKVHEHCGRCAGHQGKPCGTRAVRIMHMGDDGTWETGTEIVPLCNAHFRQVTMTIGAQGNNTPRHRSSVVEKVATATMAIKAASAFAKASSLPAAAPAPAPSAAAPARRGSRQFVDEGRMARYKACLLYTSPSPRDS